MMIFGTKSEDPCENAIFLRVSLVSFLLSLRAPPITDLPRTWRTLFWLQCSSQKLQNISLFDSAIMIPSFCLAHSLLNRFLPCFDFCLFCSSGPPVVPVVAQAKDRYLRGRLRTQVTSSFFNQEVRCLRSRWNIRDGGVDDNTFASIKPHRRKRALYFFSVNPIIALNASRREKKIKPGKDV